MNQDNMLFTADKEEKSIRLDVFLAKQLEELSRAYIQKLIANANVTVNGKPAKSNYKMRPLDSVEVCIPPAEIIEIKPEPIPLDIIYEDEHIIVINKPRGMVVHPAVGNYSGTLVNALLYHCRDLSGINGAIRPGIVHRLDKDTSGVMVAAKNDKAHASLAFQIKERIASRRYLTIVHGNLKEEQGVINAPIGRHPVDRQKMSVTFTNSKEAITKFKIIRRFGDYSFIECKLLTGRTHQIRVHMAYIGHPVVGDPKYGPQRSHFGIAGQALHSTELLLNHPVSGKKMTFSAPLPSDMQEILAFLSK